MGKQDSSLRRKHNLYINGNAENINNNIKIVAYNGTMNKSDNKSIVIKTVKCYQKKLT